MAACAVLAGAKSLAAIAEWAADAPPNVLARLCGPCREPDRGPVAPATAEHFLAFLGIAATLISYRRLTR
ncbi:hypothetical protein [Streptomyces sp. NPDC001621]|uniref:hypothetical protein n=1 Tax=Streptomyces sp. NPDC001621 TaxID=3364594 RepID=UPI003680EF11